MSRLDDFDSRAKRLGILDIKLVQGAAICLALVIVKLVPRILELSIWWFVVVGLACAARPMFVFFGRRPAAPRVPR